MNVVESSCQLYFETCIIGVCCNEIILRGIALNESHILLWHPSIIKTEQIKQRSVNFKTINWNFTMKILSKATWDCKN
jgi:glutaminase